MEVGALGDELFGVGGVAAAGELVEGGDAEPIGGAGVHAVLEEEMVDGFGFSGDSPGWETDREGEFGLIAKHEADEGFVACAGGVGEGVGIVGESWVGVENGGGGLEIVEGGEEMDRASGAVLEEEVAHFIVLVGQDAAEGIGGAFDFGVRVSAGGEEEFGDFVVAVGGGEVESFAAGGEAFFGEVGIGTVFEEEFNDLEMASGGGVAEGGARTGVVTGVIGEAIDQGGITAEESADLFEVANVGGCADITMGTERAEVGDGFPRAGTGRGPPVAEMVIATGDLDGAGAIEALGVEIGAAAVEFVDDGMAAGHGGPMDGLVAALVTGVEEFGRLIEESFEAGEVIIANGGGGRFARGADVAGGEFAAEERVHFGVAAVGSDLEEGIVEGEIERIGIEVEEEFGDLEAIFADGEIEGFAVMKMGAREGRIAGEEAADGFEISTDAGAEEVPEIEAATGGPDQGFVGGELWRLSHFNLRFKI